MTDTQDYALTILSLDEGRKCQAYTDTKGIWTAGIGRNVQQKRFSEDEIDFMFQTDYNEAIEWLKHKHGWNFLNGPRKVVLISMYHQMGSPSLSKFKKMWTALKEDDYDLAAKEMLDSKWATKDTPARANRLVYTMRTGLFSPYYKDVLSEANLNEQTF